MKIGIIGAMHEEIVELKNSMKENYTQKMLY